MLDYGPMTTRFKDRAAAGRALAPRLLEATSPPSVILGIPHGGIVTAAAIASALGAPLAPVWIRKLVAPREADVVIGAVDLDGDVTICLDVIRAEGLDEDTLVELAYKARERLAAEAAAAKAPDASKMLAGATAIIVDDALFSGLTARAAIRWARKQHARAVVAAVPIVPREMWRRIADEADQAICLEERDDGLLARSDIYEDYLRPSEQAIARILAAAAASTSR